MFRLSDFSEMGVICFPNAIYRSICVKLTKRTIMVNTYHVIILFNFMLQQIFRKHGYNIIIV